ncbi:MAG: TRAP transporter large permease [Proteobacteria bacterium]|nr:TRAP transporter large permease [Pseudomonadota bacterium]MBU1388246.1 TRAP transporter large permease [Pseudomonadota bacterium]MBU1541865.1 TRAP transporter large permease [Pseudomonadota bacterium]MBU2431745.1 TRAP transporter large permease [Pseudomonadota bacterium]MBU2479614.1 TRAP transporter large permease [Pseudomonadota bacterium]
MSPTLIGILGIIVMILLFLTRMPVAFVMAAVGFAGFSMLSTFSAGLALLPRNVYEVFSSYDLTTIPLFILMGQLGFNSGISKRLYDVGYKFLGSTRGGLAMATVSACTAFGAVCGSSPATAATMATVGLPEMKRYNYDDELSTGSVASGGGLGMIMPPSVVLIIYGILTEQSIGQLFVAGIFPAILVTVLFIIAIYIRCTISPDQGPKGESFSWAQKIKALSGLGETLAVFILVIGGIFKGFFTPTEAAAVGAFGVLAIAIVRRQITFKGFIKSLEETLKTSCMVMMLIAGAVIFGKFLAITRIPFEIAGWISSLEMAPYLVIGVIILIYFLGGCFMDALAFVTLTVPIFFPVVQNLGYDPIWFGIIIVMVTEMGVITPPVGINVYVVYGVARTVLEKEIPLEKIFKGIIPFLIAIIAGIIILIMFPKIILFLPHLMYAS